MILAAHQPNFFPWLGFFNKIHRADVFVLLDDVQMVKTGSSWFNRCNFLINNEAKFVTMSVSRPSGTVLIMDAMINDPKWKKKLVGNIHSNYGRHPYYRENIEPIAALIEASSDNLCELNLAVLSHLIRLFGLEKTRILKSSEVEVATTSTQRLIDLVKKAGCDTYLEGGGATGYQEDNLFQQAGIALLKQSFVHPAYPQRGNPSFVAGLSILDSLFNCGVIETKKLIMAGVS
jgi:hypothetical protein